MNTKVKNNIAKENDAFRRSGNGVVLTGGAMEIRDCLGLLDRIKKFKDFNTDNDPYGEHDFGSLVWMGEKVFWKIDYYDEPLKAWKDPNSSGCRRVLTVMLASEY
jgi:hypothetical protein